MDSKCAYYYLGIIIFWSSQYIKKKHMYISLPSLHLPSPVSPFVTVLIWT